MGDFVQGSRRVRITPRIFLSPCQVNILHSKNHGPHQGRRCHPQRGPLRRNSRQQGQPRRGCKSGKHVIMGVPGAFTPTCSKTHLPGYVAKAEELKSQGVGQIFCVSVNDPFVMAAWGENQGAEGKVRMLADTCGEFTKAMEVDLDVTAVLGNVRCKRFSIMVEDGKATKVNIEPDGTGATCSLADNILG